jgi:SAM-dependent methyltransferase
MVREADRRARAEGVADRFRVEVGDLLSPPFPNDFFDAVYTERSLINLNGSADQARAIEKLVEKLKPSGKLILCESFVDGLEEINAFRKPLGLAAIEQPWHNHYLSLDELEETLPENAEILEISNFSSTYYFLSRVVNAWEARREGVEPSYDAPINQLAFSLPSIEVCAQAKIVVLGRR